MISTRKKSPFFALARSRAAENFKPTRTPQEGGALSSASGEGEGAFGTCGAARGDSGPVKECREPKRRGVLAVFEGGKDQHGLGRRGKSARKKKSID